MDNNQPIDYKQFDKRWAKVMYSGHGDKNQTIQSSGCGPTSMADIIATWFDSKITPVDMCKLAVAKGYRTFSDGTAFNFFNFIARQYNFKSFKRTDNTDEVCAALQAGALVIACMGPGFWTKGGHFICLWKYDPKLKRIFANDPGSSYRKYSSVSIFKQQEREYFIFAK